MALIGTIVRYSAFAISGGAAVFCCALVARAGHEMGGMDGFIVSVIGSVGAAWPLVLLYERYGDPKEDEG